MQTELLLCIRCSMWHDSLLLDHLSISSPVGLFSLTLAVNSNDRHMRHGRRVAA